MTDTITLPPDVYWQMRALARDAEVALVDLQRKALERSRQDDALRPYRQAWEAAYAAQRAFLDDLGARYGMSPDGAYTWDDATYTITRNGGPDGE